MSKNLKIGRIELFAEETGKTISIERCPSRDGFVIVAKVYETGATRHCDRNDTDEMMEIAKWLQEEAGDYAQAYFELMNQIRNCG